MRGRFKKYQRFKRFKKRKSLLKSSFFWYGILIGASVISIFYLFFLSEMFRVKEIEISAPEDISREEIQALLEEELKTPFCYFFRKNTFFLVNSKRIEDKILNEYPEIKEVTLQKRFPRKLSLELKKREAVGVWCFEEDNCFFIDGEGIIYGEQFSATLENGKREDLIRIFPIEQEIKKPGENVVSPEKMSQLLKIQNELAKNRQIEVEKFTLKEGMRLDVKTIKGWEIYFDLASDIKLALTKLGLLLEKEIPPEERENLQYIDLRFSKAYYK